MKRSFASLLLVAAVASQALAREAVWLEGEGPARHTFFKHSWYHRVKTEALSGGDWLSHYRKDAPGEAEYKFTIKEGGKYTWWLRCNVALMRQRYSLDGPEPKLMDLSATEGEKLNIAPQGMDHRILAWVKGGELDLKPGEHTLKLITQSDIANHGGIDCMAFVNFDWKPSGVEKPEGALVQGSKAPPPAEKPPAPAPAGPKLNAEAVEGKGEWVWLEGEAPAKHTFKKHGWYDNVKKDLLSGGEWLSHYNAAAPGEATYEFELKLGGKYAWWLRCNVSLMTQHYRLDGGEPVEMDLTSDVRGRMNLAGKPDHRFIGWVKGGTFDLKPGKHSLTITTSSKIANHGGIDCMCFASFPWAPAGTDRPSLAAGGEPKPDEWFAVLPDDDPFSDKSITDMSRLLDKPAGIHGLVQRKGKDFVFEKTGQPVKFWGMVAGIPDAERLWDQQARLYAKHGVNMIRTHTVQAVVGLLQRDPATGQRALDKAKLDRWDRWFATMKKQGIYATWSSFYPHVVTPDDGYPAELYAELPVLRGGRGSSGLVNFMPQLQDAEWEWLQTLLLHKNPHTGLRYVDDPALAIVEVHNEDCVFWHAPLNQLEPANTKFPRHVAILKRNWMEWLQKRYANDDALKAAWGAGMRQGDSLTNPAMGIYGAWEMDADGPRRNKAEKRRLGDFIRFLAETQRAYYERRQKRLRDLGFRGVTVSTAWRAGGPAADPVNLWADDAMDCITRHNYFGGGAGGHDIAVGKVNNESHMGQPGSHLLAIGFYQVEDKPFLVTEWTQMPPNQWKAEAAPLFAFYLMGLQGLDASYHFAGGRTRMGSGWPDMRSYVSETPHYFGQFPALAFAVHKGHIKEAPLAAARRRTFDEVCQGFDALSQDFSGGGYDNKELVGNLATPMEVLAIGRVTAKIADGLEHSTAVDWAKWWDKGKKVVRSMTGELTWDYGRRVVTLHAPKTQALIGFAAGGDYDLPGVRVQVPTPFVSLLFTPLDDKPLVESRHILITAMARDKQAGAEYNADGTRLLDAGKPPLLMEPVQATLTFKGAPIASVKVVDIYGVPTAKDVARQGNAFTIDGRYATYYYEVKR
ncbi:MAG TPA: beta-galactosidase [Planctomycetota bacterium]|nr:beta-galactosidase [Planctomycetota bacterium]